MTTATTHTRRKNIFTDLGFPEDEAIKLELKFFLMESIRNFIKREEMTQAKAAEFFGTTQPKISILVKGDPDGFTIDRMVRMVGRTGGKLRYSFKPPRKGAVRRRKKQLLETTV
jgi:predicted XRE-type DNA-binding protein